MGAEAALSSTRAAFSRNEKQTQMENPGARCHLLFWEMGERKKVVENVVTILIEQHTMSVKENSTRMLLVVTGWKQQGEAETLGESWCPLARGHWLPNWGTNA